MITFMGGNKVALLENGVSYFPALVAAIDTAEHEIHLETYIFENDATGNCIAGALARAAQRGVVVRVLVDGFGARSFIDSLMPSLLADGVEVQVYRREIARLSFKRHRLRRMHRKIVLIDGRLAFVGGINVVDDFPPGGPSHPRYDYAVSVEGPLLKEIRASVHHLWWFVSWVKLKRPQRRPARDRHPIAEVGTIRAAFVIRDNLRWRRNIEEAYVTAIDHARKDVIIACAYFFPGRSFKQVLIAAAHRGVRVTLLLQGLSDHPVLAYATRALYPHLLGCGIRLFEYHQSYLHAKVAVVDTHWATVGSSNIDPFSLLTAREANIVIDDEDFAYTLRASLNQAMNEGATELRYEDWERLSWLHRFTTWLAYQVVRLAIGVAGFRDMH